MEAGKFSKVAANQNHPTWDILIKRENSLYSRKNDIRTDFNRDYTRILHSLAYRRLKHKTQVFFNTQNDHICTRIEHVNHVDSVSHSIAAFLGLNTDLTKAIATGHDLGHAPFGHQGEIVIKNLTKQYLNEPFWHERHGLYCVDNIELLKDEKRNLHNLNLTYAVRDGIISHCGEIDEQFISPRKDDIDLYEFDSPGVFQPYTWEACVVKISDKIAYIGRDIEDAVRLNFIGRHELHELLKLARKFGFSTLNTTLIIHELIIDLCQNSSPKEGLRMTPKNIKMMNDVKQFNYQYIYNSEKFNCIKNYISLVITSIFKTLYKRYTADNTYMELLGLRNIYPELTNEFISWLNRYTDFSKSVKYKNKKIYSQLEDEKIY